MRERRPVLPYTMRTMLSNGRPSSVRMARFVLQTTMIALASWGVGCETTVGTTGGEACTYGEIIKDCVTDSGCHSTQECLPDLSGYGPCTCTGDAGKDGDAHEKDGN